MFDDGMTLPFPHVNSTERLLVGCITANHPLSIPCDASTCQLHILLADQNDELVVICVTSW